MVLKGLIQDSMEQGVTKAYPTPLSLHYFLLPGQSTPRESCFEGSLNHALCSPEKFPTDSFVSLNSKVCGESFFEERITFEFKRISKPKYGLRTELLVFDQVSTPFGS